MNVIKNEGYTDRAMRVIVGVIFFMIGFFWVGGWIQKVAYIVSFASLATALFGFCGAYTLLGIRTCPVDTKEEISLRKKIVFSIVLISLIWGGSYASIFFTKKIFLEDYSAVNQYYKQALFYSGQEKRDEAVFNYTSLVSQFDQFNQKYQTYHPYVLFQDKNLNADLQKVSSLIALPKDKIISGDLKSAHLDLENVRPIFQDILKRNGFSLLAVYLVDFHDAMEKIISAADDKDAERVIAVYGEVNEKLLAVEETLNDAEIQAIRKNLDAVLMLSQTGDTSALSSKANELKSSFVKVYLVKG